MERNERRPAFVNKLAAQRSTQASKPTNEKIIPKEQNKTKETPEAKQKIDPYAQKIAKLNKLNLLITIFIIAFSIGIFVCVGLIIMKFVGGYNANTNIKIESIIPEIVISSMFFAFIVTLLIVRLKIYKKLNLNIDKKRKEKFSFKKDENSSKNKANKEQKTEIKPLCRFCPYCHKEISGSAVIFCPKCGKRIDKIRK